MDEVQTVIVETEFKPPSFFERHKKCLFFVSLLLSLLLMATYLVGNLIIERFLQTPEKIVESMTLSLKDVSKYKYSGKIIIRKAETTSNLSENDALDLLGKMLYGDSDNLNLAVGFSGAIDVSDKENFKQSVLIEAGTGLLTTYRVELISLNAKHYVKFGRGGLGALSSIISVNEYEDVWIEMDPDKLAEKYAKDFDLKGQIEYQKKLVEELDDYVRQNFPIDLAEDLESEEVAGEETFVLSFSINEENLANVLKIILKKVDWAIDQYADEAFDYIDFENGKLWVGKKDRLPRRVILTTLLHAKSGDPEIIIDLELNFKDFGEDIEVTEPISFKSFDDLFAKEYSQKRDTQRRSDLMNITNAVYQYAAEHNGDFTFGFPKEVTCIGQKSACYDLGRYVIPDYIRAIPFDPLWGNEDDTGYTIFVDTQGRIEAQAKGELVPTISVTR